MPFDGSGNFSRLYSWQSDRDQGIHILASKMDDEFNNLVGGMNVVFFRNGLVPMSGNLNMGQNYVQGIGAGSVGALSVKFADDPNSGMYLNGYGKPTLVAGGANILQVTSAGASVTGTLNSSGNLSENGSRVWSAATLTPGNYALLTGATFSGPIKRDANYYLDFSGSSPVINFDTNDYNYYDRVNNAYNYIIGGNNVLNFSATGATFSASLNSLGYLYENGSRVWSAATLTPGNYALLTGATFTGAIKRDPNFYLDLYSGSPIVNFDVNDNVSYDRMNDAFSVNIASTNRLYVNGTGGTVSGNFTTTGNMYGNGLLQIGTTGSGVRLQQGSGTPGYVELYNSTGTRAGYVGYSSGTLLNLSAESPFTGWNVLGTLNRNGGGQYLSHDTSGRSGNLSRGTAAPSGGSDGDIYLQYV